MAKMNIIICGLGGQGILFMTKIMAQSALNKGYQVMGAETHGMAQRGGSVISHLRLGNVSSSLVRMGSAHLMLALEESESYRFLPFLRNGGDLYVNAGPNSFPMEAVRPYTDKKRIICRALAADKIAQDLESPRSANLVQLGFFSAFAQEPMTAENLKETIDLVSPEPFKDLNFKAFEAGLEQGKAQRE
jgi:indolepyruvate ferredoxin oxidoreductase beta subunit